MKKYIVLFTVLIGFASCENPYQDVEFKRIENPIIKNMTGNLIEIEANCVLYNPNSVGITISAADFDVFVNGSKSAEIHQTADAEVPANAEFNFPISAKISPKEIYGDRGNNLLGLAVQALSNKRVDIKYSGVLEAGKGGFNMDIPVIDSVQVPFKLKF